MPPRLWIRTTEMANVTNTPDWRPFPLILILKDSSRIPLTLQRPQYFVSNPVNSHYEHHEASASNASQSSLMKHNIHQILQDLSCISIDFRLKKWKAKGNRRPRCIFWVITVVYFPEVWTRVPRDWTVFITNFARSCLLFLWVRLNCKLVFINHETADPETLGCGLQKGTWRMGTHWELQLDFIVKFISRTMTRNPRRPGRYDWCGIAIT